jgi:hypothetical protein
MKKDSLFTRTTWDAPRMLYMYIYGLNCGALLLRRDMVQKLMRGSESRNRNEKQGTMIDDANPP